MKQIILISGKLQSGKNTFADLLKEELEKNNITVGQDSFAKLLKDMCKEGFKPLIDFLNDIFKKRIENHYVEIGIDQCALIPNGLEKFITKDENWYENKNDITRMILQIVGTDIVRKINPNYWVEQFMERCNLSKCQVILNTDVRFPNECFIPKYNNGTQSILIRVNRNIERIGDIHNHPSETSLDSYTNWDYVIDNNSDLNALKENAVKICNIIVDKINKI
jgi:hypothetical protein